MSLQIANFLQAIKVNRIKVLMVAVDCDRG